MQIHELAVKKKKQIKRIGRGGKRGTYSGKGSKGQKARSGAKINPLFEGGRSSLVERLKKMGGFKSIAPKKAVVNLKDLDKKFQDGGVVDIKSLVKSGLIDKMKAKNGVKILGDGKITKKLEIGKEILLSRSAEEAIKKAGGKIAK